MCPTNNNDAPNTTSTSTMPMARANPRRIFVACLSPNCAPSQLREFFSSYGTVTDVTVHNLDKSRGSESYAFVTYAHEEEARVALRRANESAHSAPHLDHRDGIGNHDRGQRPLFKNVRQAEPYRSATKAYKYRESCRNDKERIAGMASRVNVVLHVNRSHLDRFLDFVTRDSRTNYRGGGVGEGGENERRPKALPEVEVLGVVKTASNNVKLVLISTSDPTGLVLHLSRLTYLTPALNKCFVVDVDEGLMTVGNSEEMTERVVDLVRRKTVADTAGIEAPACSGAPAGGAGEEVVKEDGENEGRRSIASRGRKRRLRVQSYPSDVSCAVADAIHDADIENVALDPTNLTDLVSVVRVYLQPPRRTGCKNGGSKGKRHGEEEDEGDEEEEGKGKVEDEEEHCEMYLAGVSDARAFLGNLNERSKERGYDAVEREEEETQGREGEEQREEVCRAYFKLQEAFSRYYRSDGGVGRYGAARPNGSASSADLSADLLDDDDGATAATDPSSSSSSSSVVVLDVGAAPGGWTKYATEKVRGCARVYSVDPAELAPSVVRDRRVEHLRMKIQDALPVIRASILAKAEAATEATGGREGQEEEEEEEESSKNKVGLYVSDMCLPVMSRQIDLMLLARESGVLRPGAFFVLTLKCNLGHSRATFDAQVREVVDGLLLRDGGAAYGVETMHLFGNRSGERTVMGHLR